MLMHNDEIETNAVIISVIFLILGLFYGLPFFLYLSGVAKYKDFIECITVFTFIIVFIISVIAVFVISVELQRYWHRKRTEVEEHKPIIVIAHN